MCVWGFAYSCIQLILPKPHSIPGTAPGRRRRQWIRGSVSSRSSWILALIRARKGFPCSSVGKESTCNAGVKWSESHSATSTSLWPHELYSRWNSPGQNTGMGSLSLLQGIFPTQGLNLDLPHCRWILYQLSHKGSLQCSGRSPGERDSNPLQYSCLGNLTDRGAWRATVHGVGRVAHNLATKPLTALGHWPFYWSLNENKNYIEKHKW